MPRNLDYFRLVNRATVALLISFIATLPQFAPAQTVAPELNPFGVPDSITASDPFNPSHAPKHSIAIREPTKTLLSVGSSKTPPITPPVLTPLRILQLGESKPGGPIASIPSDPYMIAEQEARIIAALQIHDDASWDGISLIELRRILKSRLPIWINRSEISNVGTDMNSAIENAGDVVAGPLGDRLACLFNDTQLGFAIHANRLEVTSIDDLNSLSNTRIYDVTPLVLRNRGGKRVFDFQSLTSLIQSTLEHDHWLNAGGNNIITDFIVGEPGSERSLIVVAAPTSVQLQLQPLLDRLNIATPRSQ